MRDWLLERAQVSPRKVAINGLDYQTYAAQARHTAASLVGEGVQAGDHVAVLATNSIAYAVTVHALRMLGAVLVPINTRLGPGEIALQSQAAECRYLLCDQSTDQLASTLEIGACQILSLDPDSSFPWLFGESDVQFPVNSDVDLEKPCAIIHTSGTSGQPKGVVLTYGNFFYSAMASAYRLGHLPDELWLSTLPLYHVGGLSILLRAVLYGIAVDLHPRFDLDAVNAALDTRPITLISLVPTMLYRLLESRSTWPASLRLILLGGAAAPPDMLARCAEIGLPVATTYGLTEAASQVATMLPDDVVKKPGSVGKPLLFTSLRIVNENNETASPGEYGEIIVSGPTVLQNYYNNPEATANTLRSGELYTGDLGYLDEDGDLYIVQRRSDLIVSGGENIYPAEVEQAIKAYPAVGEVAVVGVADAEWGQRVVAAVVLRTGETLNQDALLSFLRARLGGYKLPRQIRFVDSLPQTASGKIQRAAVRTLFEDFL